MLAEQSKFPILHRAAAYRRTGFCSTAYREHLFGTTGFRYASDTVFATFPWPQKPSAKQIRAVADAGCELRAFRRQIMDANGWSLRDLYRTLETPGDNKLRAAHATLDTAVRAAYGMKANEDILAFLLNLNLELAAKEAKGEPITPPGLPSFVAERAGFISDDCVRVPGTVYPPYEPPNPTPLKKPNPVQAEADAAHFYSAKEEPPPYRTK